MIGLSIVFLSLVGMAPATADEIKQIIVTPKTDDKPLLNPGKGWVLGWYPENNSSEDLKYAGLGYTRFEWSEIEPNEGRFNWESIDRLITSWADLGKQCAFGVMCTNTGVDRYVTPRWVFEAGAPVRIWQRKPYDENNPAPDFLVWNGPQGKEKIYGEQTWDVMTRPIEIKPGYCVEVADYHHPVFLKKLRNFLVAMAKRYDGNPNIAYIDIRSYLNYGEQFHLEHVKLHLEIFKKTQLCQSCPHYGDYPEFDWTAKQGVAIRRDGIGGSDGRECARVFGYAPAIFEFWGYYDFLKSQDWWRQGRMLREAVEIGKPSYIAMPVCSGGKSLLELHKEELPLIKELTNRMGYHFVLKKAEYPEYAYAGKEIAMEFIWQNKGVAPIYIPCALAIALLDSEGIMVEKYWPTQSDPKKWYPDKVIKEKVSVIFNNAKSGKYNLCVGLFNHVGDQHPTIRIASEGVIMNGWYQLGEIEIRMNK